MTIQIYYSSLISKIIMLKELKEKLKIRENKRKVLFSLLVNTHCTGCGRHNFVCFWGYCGEYCDKGCWKRFHDDRNSAYDEDDNFRLWWIYEKYKDLENINLKSYARIWKKKYNRKYSEEYIDNSRRRQLMMTYSTIFL